MGQVEAQATYWSELPMATRHTLKALREATATNPLLAYSGTAAASCADARELLAMVRESLAEQAHASKL